MSFVQSRTQTARHGIGKAVPRKEDERLLQGKGCYGDDFNLSGQAYAIMVRSPHAHARIASIDTPGGADFCPADCCRYAPSRPGRPAGTAPSGGQA